MMNPENDYTCFICHTNFNNKDCLTQHRKNSPVQHENDSIKCPTCNKPFCGKGSLSRHIKKMHFDEYYKCHFCNKTYDDLEDITKHYKSENHITRITNLAKLSEINNLHQFYLDLKNKNGQIVAKTQVNKMVYIHVLENDLCLCLGADHVLIHLPNTLLIQYNSEMAHIGSMPFHRYIYYNLYNKPFNKNMKIDHDDRDPLNNCIDNLFESDDLYNANNKSKKPDSSSHFYGVRKDEYGWACSFTYDYKNYYFSYRDELWAAYHYDLLVNELNMKGKPCNNIKEPEGFKRKGQYIKKSGLPEGINAQKGKYFYYNWKHKAYHGFNSVKDAVKARNQHIYNDKIKTEREYYNTPIKRNFKGIAIIELYNQFREKVAEALIDDDWYYFLNRYSWWLDISGYVLGRINGKTVRLGRIIMNCTDRTLRVDHMKGNTLDHRCKRLEIVDDEQNAQNKSKSKNITTSKYMGVFFNKDNQKWRSYITYKRKAKHLGYFLTEVEAATARDNYLKELRVIDPKIRYKLNFR